jgi:hypothetical protein
VRAVVCIVVVLCFQLSAELFAQVRPMDTTASSVPRFMISGGFGIGWGSIGSSIGAHTVESVRIPLVFASSVSYPLHALHSRFFIMGTTGVTLGLAVMSNAGGEIDHTSVDVNVPLLVGIQYGGVRRGLMPFGMGLAIGPTVKYESRQAPGVVALTSMAEIIFVGSGDFRIRAAIELLPGSSDGAALGSSRFLKHSNIQFLWSTKL